MKRGLAVSSAVAVLVVGGCASDSHEEMRGDSMQVDVVAHELALEARPPRPRLDGAAGRPGAAADGAARTRPRLYGAADPTTPIEWARPGRRWTSTSAARGAPLEYPGGLSRPWWRRGSRSRRRAPAFASRGRRNAGPLPQLDVAEAGQCTTSAEVRFVDTTRGGGPDGAPHASAIRKRSAQRARDLPLATWDTRLQPGCCDDER